MKIPVNNTYHKQFFVQSVEVDLTFKNSNRIKFFLEYIKNKKVLHVGFVDWPITNVGNNLHLSLAEHCLRLDGIDKNSEHADSLRVPNGNIFSNWDNVPNDYDVILVPEVIEHVGNVEEFLKLVSSRNGTLIITAPDAFLLQHHFELTNNFLEVVHPDHNCWYTPYTLKNTVEKYTNKKVESVHWINSQSVAVVCK